jgi:hypothetical protein
MPLLYCVGDGGESEMRLTGMLKDEWNIRNLYESIISRCGGNAAVYNGTRKCLTMCNAETFAS